MKHFLFLFSLNLLSLTTLWGQEPSVIHFTTTDGLPSSTIYDILQDRKGYIWIATDKGVAKFDGYTFKTFTLKDGLANNDVWELFEDKRGRMWLASFGNSLSYIKDDEVTTVEIDNQKLTANYPFVEDSRGNLYIKRHLRIYSYTDSLQLKLRVKESQLGHFDIGNQLFAIDSSEKYWAYGEYLRIYSRENTNPIVDEIIDVKEYPKNYYSQVTLGNYFIYWNDNGLFAFNFLKREFANFSLDILFPNRKEDAVLKYLDNGFFRWGDEVIQINENLQIIERSSNFGNLQFHKIFKDREGNFWFTANGGIYFQPVQWREAVTYNPTDIVSSVFYDKNHKTLFFGTSDFEIHFLNEEKITSLTMPKIDEKSIGRISKIINNNADSLFFIVNYVEGGLFVLNTKKLLEQKENFFIKSVKRSANYSKWMAKKYKIDRSFAHLGVIGSQKDMIWDEKRKEIVLSYGINVKLNKKYYDHFFWFRRATRKNPKALYLKGDNMFFGTEDGLFYTSDYVKTQSSNLLFIEHDEFKNLLSLDMDKNDVLWVGTNGIGLWACKNCENANRSLIQIKETENDFVFSTKVDNQGNVWASTNNGLKKITITDKNKLTHTIKAFTISDGLRSNEVNSFDWHGKELYLGTSRGLTVLKDDDVKKDTSTPLIYFTNLKINQKDTTILDRYILRHNQNDITINYVALSYKSHKRLRYLYLLEGADREAKWRETTFLEREYPNLSPGLYTFNVKAVDVNGQESETIAVHFLIQQPWWRTNWFISVLLLLATFSVWKIIQIRIGNIQRKAEREKEVSKKLAEVELKALQAQMNPHFISNALTSIQNFILKKDNFTASQYLSKFSHLMRLFLDASVEKYISLQKEIDLLKSYIELEQMRFPDKFDVVWNIDKKLDTSVEFPAMLLQPFVENSINYGLVYKKSKGCLTISFNIDGENLICLIEDDGIGRKKAQNLKTKSYKSYKSRGMMLVEERLNTLKQIEEVNTYYKVEDIDLSKEDCGTRVRIVVPLLY